MLELFSIKKQEKQKEKQEEKDKEKQNELLNESLEARVQALTKENKQLANKSKSLEKEKLEWQRQSLLLQSQKVVSFYTFYKKKVVKNNTCTNRDRKHLKSIKQLNYKKYKVLEKMI